MAQLRLTPDERDRITRFRAGFNAVEQSIRRRFGGSQKRFLDLIDTLCRMHPEWKYRENLSALTRLRNDVAHAEGTEELRAVPTERAVLEVNRVLKSVMWLVTVGQRFQRKVECVDRNDSLAEILQLIRRRNYSQFPVVDGKRLLGLITENGITCWLAKNFEKADTLNALGTVRIGDLLGHDDHRRAFAFVPVTMTVEAAVDKMSLEPGLEALLIVGSKSRHIPPKGIITRWDVLQLLGSSR